MSDQSALERPLREHAAFERDDDGFAVTSTVFEATVTAVTAADPPHYRVTVTVPILDRVVAGERVAPVVQEGWLETFELRLEDVGGVTHVEVAPPTLEIDGSNGTVVVETTVPAAPPSRGVDAAKAVVDYVEGTYVEGIIPGYTYREPVAGLIDRARSAGER